jgi:hypothetical protein
MVQRYDMGGNFVPFSNSQLCTAFIEAVAFITRWFVVAINDSFMAEWLLRTFIIAVITSSSLYETST